MYIDIYTYIILGRSLSVVMTESRRSKSRQDRATTKSVGKDCVRYNGLYVYNMYIYVYVTARHTFNTDSV